MQEENFSSQGKETAETPQQMLCPYRHVPPQRVHSFGGESCNHQGSSEGCNPVRECLSRAPLPAVPP